MTGTQHVRDLWRQKDLGVMDGKIEFPVGRHGTVVVLMRAEK